MNNTGTLERMGGLSVGVLGKGGGFHSEKKWQGTQRQGGGKVMVCQEMHVIWGFRAHIFECVCVAVANTVNSTRAETITSTRFSS